MNKLKHHPFLFLGVVFLMCIINILQASNTQLLPDEAYYWVYSQHLDWGYFDHPPMVALFIKMSGLLFSGELGVRFLSGISYAILAYLIWSLIEHPNKKEYTWLYLLIFCSTFLLHAYGFITVPDTPLLLFIALFLWSYKRYLHTPNFWSYAFISITIAGMLYSKYHGVLVVLFVALSNIKVFKDGKLWLAVLGAILLFFPHLYWQFENDFPSIKYHLYERASVSNYAIEDSLLHLVNAIAIVGVTFPIVYTAFIKELKTQDPFRKALNYLVIGFLVFFFFMSFRGHVQAQWIGPIMFSLIISTFYYLTKHPAKVKRFVVLASINIACLLFARLVFANKNILPLALKTYGQKEWSLELQQKGGNTDKVFINSYQNAATYWFYTKEQPHYLKNYLGRKNHFELLENNMKFTKDSVAHITRIRDEYTQLPLKGGSKDSVFVSYIQHLEAIYNITMQFNQANVVLQNTIQDSLPITLNNPYKRTLDLTKAELFIVFQNQKATKKYTVPAHTNLTKISSETTSEGMLYFNSNTLRAVDSFPVIGIGLRNSEKMDVVKLSYLAKYILKK